MKKTDTDLILDLLKGLISIFKSILATLCCVFQAHKRAESVTKQYKLATNDKKDLKLNTEAEWKP